MSLYGPGRASLTHGFEMSSRTICCQITLLGFEALLHVWSIYELELLSAIVPVAMNSGALGSMANSRRLARLTRGEASPGAKKTSSAASCRGF